MRRRAFIRRLVTAAAAVAVAPLATLLPPGPMVVSVTGHDVELETFARMQAQIDEAMRALAQEIDRQIFDRYARLIQGPTALALRRSDTVPLHGRGVVTMRGVA